MSESQGTLRAIAQHLAGAVEPLDLAFRDVDHFRTLMWQLGFDAQGLPPSYLDAADKVLQAVGAVEALVDDADIESIVTAIQKVGVVYQAIDTLAEAPPGVDAAEFLSEIGRRLFEYLLAEYLRNEIPGLFMGLEAIGIVDDEDVPATATRPGFTRTVFDWEALPDRLSDPLSIPADVYGWGSDDLNFGKFAEVFSELFIALGLPVSVDQVEPALGSAFQAAATGAPAARIDLGISVPLFDFPVGGTYHDVGFRILEMPAEGSALPGLIVQPLVPQNLALSVDLTPDLTFKVRAGTDLANQLGVVLRPDEIDVRFPFAPGTPLPSAGFGIALDYDGDEPFPLFGNPGGIRLELKSASLSADLNLKAGQLELKAAVAPQALALVLTAADLDGFLGAALGGTDLRIEFPLSIAWSNRTGLDFTAGLGFEVALYPHLDFGVLSFDRVDLALRFMAGSGEPPQLDLCASTALSGAIGPLAYSVDRLGVHLPLLFQPGNAGPFNIEFGVLWPTGLGLVVDAGMVTGGGFIKLDPDAGRYCGILELKMFEIGVTAIGILDTKDAAGQPLPPPGFSFFMSIFIDLPPIQLGYGFTLNGVGGLVGINRRMDADAILSGVREGALDSIMFPDDPVANANTIISNLTTIFPIAINRYVFGPLAILGWGTPTLVEVELGVVLEVPAPILLALLGKASVAIPTKDVAIIALNLDVVGILDFGRSLLAVDASLRDSYVATFSIYGDMAMRLSFGSAPNFALSVGGLNPNFASPPDFPALRRVTVALGLGDNPRISLEGYFAITSNSLQFGARAELYAEAAGFNIHGWLGFDALLIFAPLSFRFDFSAGMTLNHGSTRIAGITVHGTLTGPSPFHAWGEGCISLLFFDVCVPFDATFGESRTVDLPDKDPWPILEAAIKALENWSAELADDVLHGVTVRAPPAGASVPLLLHPMGTATLRQKVLPFNRPLERFGEFEIVGPHRYDIAGVVVGDETLPSSDVAIVTDHFAPGDFEDLSDTEKLSRDSFESMAAGVSVGGDFVFVAEETLKVAKVTYETRIIDSPWDARVLPLFVLSRAVQILSALRGAKGFSRLRRSGRGKFARDVRRDSGVQLEPQTYAVATTDTLAARADIAAGTTRGAAYLAVKTRVGRGARASGVQVVPTHELERAA